MASMEYLHERPFGEVDVGDEGLVLSARSVVNRLVPYHGVCNIRACAARAGVGRLLESLKARLTRVAERAGAD